MDIRRSSSLEKEALTPSSYWEPTFMRGVAFGLLFKYIACLGVLGLTQWFPDFAIWQQQATGIFWTQVGIWVMSLLFSLCDRDHCNPCETFRWPISFITVGAEAWVMSTLAVRHNFEAVVAFYFVLLITDLQFISYLLSKQFAFSWSHSAFSFFLANSCLYLAVIYFLPSYSLFALILCPSSAIFMSLFAFSLMKLEEPLRRKEPHLVSHSYFYGVFGWLIAISCY